MNYMQKTKNYKLYFLFNLLNISNTQEEENKILHLLKENATELVILTCAAGASSFAVLNNKNQGKSNKNNIKDNNKKENLPITTVKSDLKEIKVEVTRPNIQPSNGGNSGASNNGTVANNGRPNSGNTILRQKEDKIVDLESKIENYKNELIELNNFKIESQEKEQEKEVKINELKGLLNTRLKQYQTELNTIEQLQLEKNKLKELHEDTLGLLKNQETEISKLKTENENTQNQLKEHKNINDELKNENKQIIVEKNVLEKEYNNNTKKQLHELEESNKTTLAEKNKLKRIETEYEEVLKTVKNQEKTIQNLKTENENTEKELVKYKNQNLDLNTELNGLKESNKATLAGINELNNKITEKENQIKELKVKIEENTSNETAINEIHEKINKIRIKIIEKEKIEEENTNKIEELTNTIKKNKLTINELNKKDKEQLSTILEKENIIKELKVKIEENTSNETAINEINEKINKIRIKIIEKEKIEEKNTNKIEELTNTIKKNKLTINELNKKDKEQLSTILEKENIIKELEADFSKTLNTARKQEEKNTNKINELKTKINELQEVYIIILKKKQLSKAFNGLKKNYVENKLERIQKLSKAFNMLKVEPLIKIYTKKDAEENLRKNKELVLKENEINVLKTKNTENENELKKITEEIKLKNSNISHYEQEKKNMETSIKELKLTLSTKEKKYEDEKSKMLNLNNQLKQKENKLIEKESLIADLKKSVNEREIEKKNLEGKLEIIEKEYDELFNFAEEQLSEIDEKENRIQKYKNINKNLEKKVALNIFNNLTKKEELMKVYAFNKIGNETQLKNAEKNTNKKNKLEKENIIKELKGEYSSLLETVNNKEVEITEYKKLNEELKKEYENKIIENENQQIIVEKNLTKNETLEQQEGNQSYNNYIYKNINCSRDEGENLLEYSYNDDSKSDNFYYKSEVNESNQDYMFSRSNSNSEYEEHEELLSSLNTRENRINEKISLSDNSKNIKERSMIYAINYTSNEESEYKDSLYNSSENRIKIITKDMRNNPRQYNQYNSDGSEYNSNELDEKKESNQEEHEIFGTITVGQYLINQKKINYEFYNNIKSELNEKEEVLQKNKLQEDIISYIQELSIPNKSNLEESLRVKISQKDIKHLSKIHTLTTEILHSSDLMEDEQKFGVINALVENEDFSINHILKNLNTNIKDENNKEAYNKIIDIILNKQENITHILDIIFMLNQYNINNEKEYINVLIKLLNIKDLSNVKYSFENALNNLKNIIKDKEDKDLIKFLIAENKDEAFKAIYPVSKNTREKKIQEEGDPLKIERNIFKYINNDGIAKNQIFLNNKDKNLKNEIIKKFLDVFKNEDLVKYEKDIIGIINLLNDQNYFEILYKDKNNKILNLCLLKKNQNINIYNIYIENLENTILEILVKGLEEQIELIYGSNLKDLLKESPINYIDDNESYNIEKIKQFGIVEILNNIKNVLTRDNQYIVFTIIKNLNYLYAEKNSEGYRDILNNILNKKELEENLNYLYAEKNSEGYRDILNNILNKKELKNIKRILEFLMQFSKKDTMFFHPKEKKDIFLIFNIKDLNFSEIITDIIKNKFEELGFDKNINKLELESGLKKYLNEYLNISFKEYVNEYNIKIDFEFNDEINKNGNVYEENNEDLFLKENLKELNNEYKKGEINLKINEIEINKNNQKIFTIEEVSENILKYEIEKALKYEIEKALEYKIKLKETIKTEIEKGTIEEIIENEKRVFLTDHLKEYSLDYNIENIKKIPVKDLDKIKTHFNNCKETLLQIHAEEEQLINLLSESPQKDMLEKNKLEKVRIKEYIKESPDTKVEEEKLLSESQVQKENILYHLSLIPSTNNKKVLLEYLKEINEHLKKDLTIEEKLENIITWLNKKRIEDLFNLILNFSKLEDLDCCNKILDNILNMEDLPMAGDILDYFYTKLLEKYSYNNYTLDNIDCLNIIKTIMRNGIKRLSLSLEEYLKTYIDIYVEDQLNKKNEENENHEKEIKLNESESFSHNKSNSLLVNEKKNIINIYEYILNYFSKKKLESYKYIHEVNENTYYVTPTQTDYNEIIFNIFLKIDQEFKYTFKYTSYSLLFYLSSFYTHIDQYLDNCLTQYCQLKINKYLNSNCQLSYSYSSVDISNLLDYVIKNNNYLIYNVNINLEKINYFIRYNENKLNEKENKNQINYENNQNGIEKEIIKNQIKESVEKKSIDEIIDTEVEVISNETSVENKQEDLKEIIFDNNKNKKTDSKIIQKVKDLENNIPNVITNQFKYETCSIKYIYNEGNYNINKINQFGIVEILTLIDNILKKDKDLENNIWSIIDDLNVLYKGEYSSQYGNVLCEILKFVEKENDIKTCVYLLSNLEVYLSIFRQLINNMNTEENKTKFLTLLENNLFGIKYLDKKYKYEDIYNYVMGIFNTAFGNKLNEEENKNQINYENNQNEKEENSSSEENYLNASFEAYIPEKNEIIDKLKELEEEIINLKGSKIINLLREKSPIKYDVEKTDELTKIVEILEKIKKILSNENNIKDLIINEQIFHIIFSLNYLYEKASREYLIILKEILNCVEDINKATCETVLKNLSSYLSIFELIGIKLNLISNQNLIENKHINIQLIKDSIKDMIINNQEILDSTEIKSKFLEILENNCFEIEYSTDNNTYIKNTIHYLIDIFNQKNNNQFKDENNYNEKFIMQNQGVNINENKKVEELNKEEEEKINAEIIKKVKDLEKKIPSISKILKKHEDCSIRYIDNKVDYNIENIKNYRILDILEKISKITNQKYIEDIILDLNFLVKDGIQYLKILSTILNCPEKIKIIHIITQDFSLIKYFLENETEKTNILAKEERNCIISEKIFRKAHIELITNKDNLGTALSNFVKKIISSENNISDDTLEEYLTEFLKDPKNYEKLEK
jgi:hypothetical protein